MRPLSTDLIKEPNEFPLARTGDCGRLFLPRQISAIFEVKHPVFSECFDIVRCDAKRCFALRTQSGFPQRLRENLHIAGP
jgi:hypothetical protein